MRRSNCPISNALEHVGDNWSLLIIRDLALMGKKTYNEFLLSQEGIATNILSSRLTNLEKNGIIAKRKHPDDGRKHIYALTAAGIDLVPILIQMLLWSEKHFEEEFDIPEAFLAHAKSDPQGLSRQIQESLVTS